ncbi:MAG: GDSL-type esterase/lipase family protein [Muribaculaceae bacterium]
MKNIFFTILVLCCYINAFAKNKDWAQYGRYEQQNAELLKTPDAVFLGNSITDFWVRNDSAFFANNNFIDRGISGQTSQQMIARFRQDVINLRPKVVVILAGINDIAQNNGPISLQNVLGNITSMCELAKFNKIKVILCSVLPCDTFLWAPEIKPAQKVIELNSLIYNYAKDNKIPYVDYHSAMSTPKGALQEIYTKDHCHPTLPGYKIMEQIILPVIKKTIGR